MTRELCVSVPVLGTSEGMTLGQKTCVTKLPCLLTANIPSCMRLGWPHPRRAQLELLLKG